MSKDIKKLFGTDGVRGIANRYPMDSETAVKLGQAVALVFRDVPGLNRIVVGKDTRLSGYVLESALVSGICSMGCDAMLLGPMPTPGIAFIAHSMRAKAGVMVSASHNPVEFNGIKFFDNEGFKLPDQLEGQMEGLIFSGSLGQNRTPPDGMGKAYRIDDAQGRYIQHLKGTFPQGLSLEGMKIVLDCANGSAYKVSPAVLSELGADVVTTATAPNGLNINDDCGALHPERMARLVTENGAHAGIALDGDADRVIMCDEKGGILDGDGILAICACHLQSKGSLAKNSVVGTTLSNMGLETTLERRGIKLLRTDVGDRYVMDTMRQEGLNLGGETSGHIIFLHHMTSGDGTLAALRILSIMCQQGRTLSEVRDVYVPLPQAMVNVLVRERRAFSEFPATGKEMVRVSMLLKGRGRLVVRYSGTEDIARVMVESEDGAEARGLAEAIADKIRQENGKKR